MYRHKKDHDALFEAFQQVQENQQIDERGGWWDKTLAKSPVAGMFGGVSQRAQGRVTSKNDSKQMMDRFWQTLGRNNQPVDAQQLANFIAKQVPGIDTTKIPEIQNLSGTITPKQVSQMMPQIVDQIHSVKAGGSPTPEPKDDVDPNSILNRDNPPAGDGTDENPPPRDGTDENPPPGDGTDEQPPAGPSFNPGDVVSWGDGTSEGEVVSINPDGSVNVRSGPRHDQHIYPLAASALRKF